MEERQADVLIVGGGPAGLAAACALYRKGVHSILIAEREKMLGGILRQCIHDGFGLTRFHTPLSGPEYAQRFIDEVEQLQIPYLTNAAVTNITKDRTVTIVTREGLLTVHAKAVVLTMGCRERTQGALSIPGERPTGVFTAGVAQGYINLYNRMPARDVIILGSGDIGLIMARRLTLEGAHVKAVFEIQPCPSGLPRNIQQCLKDYNIPLYLSHTVTQIHGDRSLQGVTISQVDSHLRPIPGTERCYECDTLILSVGLIPENDLSLNAGVTLSPKTKGAVVDENYMTSVPGIFAAGNVLHVHDVVDFVSLEAENLAGSVADYVKQGSTVSCPLSIRTTGDINHTVPMRVSGTKSFLLSLRVSRPMKDCVIEVCQGDLPVGRKVMKKALPAEMIQIRVSGEALNTTEDLTVRVQEGVQ